MSFSWSRSDGSQNGVSYSAGSGSPPNADTVGGYVIDTLTVTGGSSHSGPTTFSGPVTFTSTVNQGGFARVAGTDFTTASLTLVDITGLTFATAASGVYAFRAMLSANGADANGLKVGVQHSGSGAAVEAVASGSLLATSAQAARISALNTLTVAFATSATDGGIVVEGILTVGANAGNLTIQLAKVTSGTATVRINSFLDVKRIA